MNRSTFRLVSRAIACSLSLSLAGPSLADDLDGDGLDDALEQYLLDLHRPILVYENDERHWPVSILDLVQHSRLRWNTHPQGNFEYGWLVDVYSEAQMLADPRLLLRGGNIVPGQPSDVVGHPGGNHWYLDINDGVLGGVFPGSDGSSHRGMYGHVVPIGGGQIQIQYWQLYPFNEAECMSDCGDHEGDWVWIDLILDLQPPNTLRSIVYHHHGDSNCTPMRLPPDPAHPFPADWPQLPLPGDGVPICCLEEQSHELWPFTSGGGECSFDPYLDTCNNASHWGNGIAYRVPPVTNVGERWAPMPNNLEAELLLLYNGHWGGWGSECFDHWFEPPDSPIHQNFPMPPTWTIQYADPASSNQEQEGRGSKYLPWRSLPVAADHVASNGVIMVTPGTYSDPGTIDKAVTIKARQN